MKKIRLFIKGYKKGLEDFGGNISNIVNSVLLLIVYIIGVGITSIVAKIFKKNFLEMKISKKETYWNDIDLNKKSKEDYYKQF